MQRFFDFCQNISVKFQKLLIYACESVKVGNLVTCILMLMKEDHIQNMITVLTFWNFIVQYLTMKYYTCSLKNYSKS